MAPVWHLPVAAFRVGLCAGHGFLQWPAGARSGLSGGHSLRWRTCRGRGATGSLRHRLEASSRNCPSRQRFRQLLPTSSWSSRHALGGEGAAGSAGEKGMSAGVRGVWKTVRGVGMRWV